LSALLCYSILLYPILLLQLPPPLPLLLLLLPPPLPLLLRSDDDVFTREDFMDFIDSLSGKVKVGYCCYYYY
jgi:hypothetical protein